MYTNNQCFYEVDCELRLKWMICSQHRRKHSTTAQKVKFSIKGFFIFCAVYPTDKYLLNENNALNKYYTEVVKSKHERQ